MQSGMFLFFLKIVHGKFPTDLRFLMPGLNVGPRHHFWLSLPLLIGSSKLNIRRRAILLIYKIYLIEPGIILPHLDAVLNRTLTIKQDHTVQSAIINILAEIISTSPLQYLKYINKITEIMNHSNNNWILIKIFKIYGFCIQH